MKTSMVIAAIYTTSAAVKLKPEKETFRPGRD